MGLQHYDRTAWLSAAAAALTMVSHLPTLTISHPTCQSYLSTLWYRDVGHRQKD